MTDKDSIVARATPPGRGGIGIVRLSGPLSQRITEKLVGDIPKPRHASFRRFYDQEKNLIDEGLVLNFPGPNSFTGEDVVELHGHGGPVVIDQLLEAILVLGARLARPGEFSERAFLNDKIDLTQAEAIADLINSSSKQASVSALRSLHGEFSKHIESLVSYLTETRVYIEACIDFSDEEIGEIANPEIKKRLTKIIKQIKAVKKQVSQGVVLNEGLHILILGEPNVGKSSLLNYLAGHDAAIVTDIAGTTRDLMREFIQIDGLPIHIIDTAGLRESPDAIEQEGIRRAEEEIKKADHVLWLLDSAQANDGSVEIPYKLSREEVTVIRNKIDLSNNVAAQEEHQGITHISLSAKTGLGMELLHDRLKQIAGFESEGSETNFIARRRHLDAIEKAYANIEEGTRQFEESYASELLAEDLREAQNALGEITGKVTSDELLGRIFSSFCIGK